MKHFPFVDDRIHHVGVSELRQFNKADLSALLPDNLYLIDAPGNETVGVLMSFETFLHLQNLLHESSKPADRINLFVPSGVPVMKI